MSCNYLAPNGKQSSLYDGLLQFVGESEAQRMWNYVRSFEFQEKYDNVPRDVNAEPTLDWVMKTFFPSYSTAQLDRKLIDESSFKSLPENATREDVVNMMQKLIDAAKDDSTIVWHIRLGEGGKFMPKKANLNTWVEALASLPLPANITLTNELRKAVDRQRGRLEIINRTDLSQPASMEIINDSALEIQRRVMFIEIRDADGNATGRYMTAEQQQTIMDSLLYTLQQILASDGSAKVVPTLDRIKLKFASLEKAYRLSAEGKKIGNAMIDTLPAEITTSRATMLKDMLNSWPQVIRFFQDYARFYSINLEIPSQYNAYAEILDPEIGGDLDEVKPDSAETLVAEARNRESWQDIDVEVNPKDTASGRLKLFLASLEDVEEGIDGQPVLKRNMLGTHATRNLDDTFESAMLTLVDIEPTLDNMIQRLQETEVPHLVRLAERLSTANEQIQNEFVRVFAKQYHTTRLILFTRKASGYVATPIDANQSSAYKVIIGQWQQAQKESPITMKVGDTLVLNKQYARDLFDRMRDPAVNKAALAGEILEAHGIHLPEKAIKKLFTRTRETLEKYNSRFTGDFTSQFAISRDGKPMGIFSSLVVGMVGEETNETPETTDVSPDLTPYKLGNPLYDQTETMSFLGRLAAAYSPRIHSSNFRNVEGKTTWAFGMNSHESTTVRKLLTSAQYRTEISRDVYAKRAWMLPMFATGRVRMEYLGGLKNRYGSDFGTPRDGMSAREQMATSLWLFQNQGHRVASYVDMTKSDKSKRSPVFSGLQKEQVTSTTVHSPRVYKLLYNIFRSEADRIDQSMKMQHTDRAYEKGSKLFYLIPEFNYDYMQALVQLGILKPEHVDALWVARGEINSANLDSKSPSHKAAFKAVIDWVLEDSIQQTLKDWRDAGMLQADDVSKNVYDERYLAQVMNNYGLEQRKDGFYRLIPGAPQVAGQAKPAEKIDDSVAWNTIHRHAAHDYSLHYMFFNSSMAQLISGDPAQTYKGKSEEDSDISRVSASLVEYVKRLAKDVAPGQDLAWKNGPSESFRVISMNDVKTAAPYLAKFNDAYMDINSTDAQELTTTEEHIYVQWAMGVIPQSVYEEMLAIIDASPDGYYEFTKPEHLEIVMQPMKPVYVGVTQDQNSGTRYIHYVKSSSYPLYPPMTRGMEIDKLRRDMENKGIARAHFASAKKIGIPTTIESVFDKSGKFLGTPKPYSLQREGFRIQQEVPYDEEKGSIGVVSQANKLIVEWVKGQPKLKFTVNGTEYSGPGISQLKEDLRKKMLTENFVGYLRKIGATVDEQGNILRVDGNTLLSTLLEEARSRNYPINDIITLMIRNEDRGLDMPLFYNASADKFESVLMALNKQVVKVKVPGKSYVQGSPTGHRSLKTLDTMTSAERNEVVYLNSYDPSEPLKGARIEDGVVKPAQILVSFDYTLQNGDKAVISDYLLEEGDEGYQPGKMIINQQKLPPELTQMVGFRIPNQGHNSMVPIEVVGFIPTSMGDLLIIPDVLTVQMGSDFDVDKLYVYRKPYKADSKGVLSVDRGIYDDYFQVHWSILTNTEVFPRMVSPLDKDDLKNEAKLADRPAELPRRHFSPTSQILDYMSQRDAKGLVASSALTVNLNALIQNLNLHLTQIDDRGRRTEYAFDFFADEFTGETIFAGRLSGFAPSYYSPKDGDRAQATVRSKSDNLTTQESEALDHAKNRVIDKINLTRYTYPASSALSLLQSREQAFSLKYNSRLFRQPIIQEFSEMMSTGNDQLSVDYITNLKPTIFDTLRSRYRTLMYQHLGDNEEPDVSLAVYTPQDMLDLINLAPNKRDARWYADQIRLLEAFEVLDSIGEELQSIQSMTSQDTRGAGASILHAVNISKRQQEKVGKMVTNWQDILGEYNEEGDITRTETGLTSQMTTETVPDVYGDLLPYKDMYRIFDTVMTQTGRNLNVQQQRAIAKSIRSLAWQKALPKMGVESSYNERVRLLFTTDSNQSLARRVMDAKALMPNSLLIHRLQVNLAESALEPETVSIQAGQLTIADNYNMILEFMDMLQSDNEQMRELGEDLVRYAVVTGAESHSQSIMAFVPASYLSAIGVGDTLSQVDMQALEMNLLAQWLQHNPNMAKRIPSSLHEITLDKGMIYLPSWDAINNDEDLMKLLIDKVDEFGKPYKELPMYLSQYNQNTREWQLYQQEYGTRYYRRIDLLGHGSIKEYTNDTINRSVFTENRQQTNFEIGPNYLFNNKETRQDDRDNYIKKWFPKEKYTQKELMTRIDELVASQDIAPAYHGTIAMFREMAEQIVPGNTNVMTRLKDLAGVAGVKFGNWADAIPTEVTLNTDLASEEVGGQYMSSTQVISLNAASRSSFSRTAASEVVAHELSHHFTAPTIMAVESLKRIAESRNRADLWDQMTQEMPEVVHYVEQLDRLRYMAKRKFLTTLNEETMNAVEKAWQGDWDALSDMVARNGALADLYMHTYLLSNNAEFAVGATSNVGFAKFLNTIQMWEDVPYTETIWDQIVDTLSKLVSVIAKSMGIKVEPGSVLYETLRTVVGVTSILTTPKYRDGVWTTSNLLEAQQAEQDGADVTFNIPVYEMRVPSAQKNKMSAEDRELLNRAIGRLTLQRDNVRERVTTANTPAAQVRKTAVLEMVKESIRELRMTENPETLRKVADQQLRWVDRILTDKKATVNDLMLAWKMTDTWVNISDLLYSKADDVITRATIPPYVKGLEEEAHYRRMQLANFNMRTALMAQARIPLTERDFDQDLTDTSKGALILRSADRTKSKLTQQVALFMQEAGRKRDEAIIRYTRDRLARLDARMEAQRKRMGLSKTAFYNTFIQENDDQTAWGMVQQFSYDWYTKTREMRRALDNELAYLGNVSSFSAASYQQQINKAWDKFRTARTKMAYTIPTHLIFDEKGDQIFEDFSANTQDQTSGKLHPKWQAIVAYQNIAKAVGKEKADLAIAEAGALYRTYLQEKEAHDTDVDSALLDNTITPQEAAEAKRIWVEENNPMDYTRQFFQDKKAKALEVIPNGALKYIMEVPRPDFNKGEFYDKKWSDIQNDTEMKGIYEEIAAVMAEMTSYLPAYLQRQLGPSFLPVVQRQMVTELSDIPKLGKWLAPKIIESLTASPYEESQETADQARIPIMFVSTNEMETPGTVEQIKARQEKVAARSRDLTRILELFGMSALHYKYFSEVRDITDMGMTIINHINQSRKISDETRRMNGEVVDEGRYLNNTITGLTYMQEALMYKRSRRLEMNTGVQLYSLNPIVQARISREVNTIKRDMEELEKEKGQMSTEDYTKAKEALETKLSGYSGRTVYGSKGADILMTITQMKALSFNPFSAMANLGFGLVSAMTHANGRVDFGHAEFFKAFALVSKHATRKSITMGAWSSPTAKKIFNVMEKTGVMADIVDSQYGKTNVPAVGVDWKRKLDPYALLRNSDYFMRALSTVAFSLKQQVTVTNEAGEKQTISAWEAFDDNGDFKYADPEWSADGDKWNTFRNRAIRVNSTIMGNMDRNSPVWTKKFMIGRLISQFRLSWMGEGLANRFEHRKWDAQMGRIVEGRWRTYGNLGFTGSLSVLGKQLLSILPGSSVNPFDQSMRNGRPMDETDIENMRRNFAELGFAAMLMGAIMMLKYMMEDDEDKRKIYQLLINMATRTEQDMWFYASSDAFNTVFNKAVPAVNTINDYQKFMKAFWRVVTDDEYEWENFILAMTRAGLPIPQAALYNKVKYMTERDLGSINN